MTEQNISSDVPSEENKPDVKSDLPKKQKLEERELLLKIGKLKRENEILKYQSSDKYRRLEAFKNYSSLGTVITAIVAIVTISWSVYQWVKTNEQNIDSKEEDKYFKAITLSTDQLPQKRMEGIAELQILLKQADQSKESQIVSHLGGILALEDHLVVRSRLVDFFRKIDQYNIDSGTVQSVLAILVDLNRELKVNNGLTYTPWISKTDSTHLKAIALGSAINGVIRKGFRVTNLSNTYLEELDFSNLQLENINLTNAVCVKCNFSNSNCSSGIFVNTVLQNSRFTDCKLTNANFTQTSQLSPTYYAMSASYNNKYTYYGPDFKRAILTNTNFKWCPLFYLGSPDSAKLLSIHPARFDSSALDNSDFTKAFVISFQRDWMNSISYFGIDSSFIPSNQSHLLIQLDGFTGHGDAENYVFNLFSSFEKKVAWTKVKLPGNIRSELEWIQKVHADQRQRTEQF